MPKLRGPRTGSPPRGGAGAVLGILLGVLVGAAACTTPRSAAGTSYPSSTSTTSLPPVVSRPAIRDLAGDPIAFGTAGYFGALAGADLGSGVVAMAASPDGHGYLLAAGNGTVFSFGDARYHGSIPARQGPPGRDRRGPWRRGLLVGVRRRPSFRLR